MRICFPTHGVWCQTFKLNLPPPFIFSGQSDAETISSTITCPKASTRNSFCFTDFLHAGKQRLMATHVFQDILDNRLSVSKESLSENNKVSVTKSFLKCVCLMSFSLSYFTLNVLHLRASGKKLCKWEQIGISGSGLYVGVSCRDRAELHSGSLCEAFVLGLFGGAKLACIHQHFQKHAGWCVRL